MSLPIASVDIANLALDHLGQAPVSSIINPASPAADVLARWYDQVRRDCLRDYIFNFARKVTLLSPSANAPTHPEFVNGYAQPIDFIRLLKLGDRILYGGAIPTQFFDFSAGYLYCDDLTDQGVGLANPAPVLSISAIYRSGDVYNGVTIPAGSTMIVLTTGTPIAGAQYQVNAVLGATQANGNVYQVTAGTLGAYAVYFLQTAAGQNFDSSSWTPYTSGGTLTPTYIPPGSTTQPQGLQVNYIYDAQNVLQFDPKFVSLVALRLAVKVCKKISGKEPSQQLMTELRNVEVAAAAVAGQEKPPMRVQRSRLRDVRRSGGIFRNNTVIGGWGP